MNKCKDKNGVEKRKTPFQNSELNIANLRTKIEQETNLVIWEAVNQDGGIGPYNVLIIIIIMKLPIRFAKW